MKKGKEGFYFRYIKRSLDICCSIAALIVLSPILLAVSLLVRFGMGKPVLFSQERIGKDEKTFVMYKFRSMSNETGPDGEPLPDSKRVSKLGKFLRSTSLDELPELLNICKGDMSFVGPRPLLVRYLPYYTDKERLRHSVRPGLTGLAQVNGRNNLRWNERLAADVRYVENLSFLNDIKIILLTIKKVLERKDVAEAGRYAIADLDQERRGQDANR